ncbi:SPOSA6832_00235 [Sporobolomyces salmonicolor]|uniref:SPOSA6832_00235-mRNA-1:cds n=1 Tax=Sporidiobolus salmonicolor TaxID=5005 RepID=A0A0D6EGS1_SPOSA|nr:SPOSA6832_00235 [Sporobolomyces salmonicolor]
MSERTPLLSDAPMPAGIDAERIAADSAIISSLDPNSSAFAVPAAGSGELAGDDEAAQSATAGVMVTEEPMRADLFVVLAGASSMWVGTFLSALDGTIVATTLSVIGSEFRVSQSISWLGTSYLMSQTAFQPLYGKASDLAGRKAATLFASVIFLLGSLACGLSRTYPQLIAARAFAGIGGGGLTTSSLLSSIVTSDLVPLRKRGVYQGLGNVVYAGGAAIGGPLGGWLGDSIGWRWAFLIQVPICVIHFAIVFWKVNIPSGPGSTVEKLKRIDYLGSVTLVSSVALLLIGLSLGGNEKPWSAPLVWGSIAGGLVVLLLFLVVETKIARDPICAPRILVAPTPLAVSFTNWFASLAQVCKYKVMLIGCGILGVIGPLSMCFWQRGRTPQAGYWLTMIPGGMGYGGIITITLVALITALRPEDMAAGTGVSYLFRATGSVLGISLSTSILQNSLAKQLPHFIKGKHAAEIISRIRTDVGYIRELPYEVRMDAIFAYQNAMRLVFIFITASASLALLAIFGIGQHDLPGRLDRKK